MFVSEFAWPLNHHLIPQNSDSDLYDLLFGKVMDSYKQQNQNKYNHSPWNLKKFTETVQSINKIFFQGNQGLENKNDLPKNDTARIYQREESNSPFFFLMQSS